jgi:hypothetical protein
MYARPDGPAEIQTDSISRNYSRSATKREARRQGRSSEQSPHTYLVTSMKYVSQQLSYLITFALKDVSKRKNSPRTLSLLSEDAASKESVRSGCTCNFHVRIAWPDNSTDRLPLYKGTEKKSHVMDF